MTPTYLPIKELDLDIIAPSCNYTEKEGGSKILVIGRPYTGKSNLIMNLMQAKNEYLPYSVVFNGSEQANPFYTNHFPPLFVHNELNDVVISRLIDRQRKIASKMPDWQNKFMGLIIDDCMSDPKLLEKPLYADLYKNGRHMKMFFVLALQYALDLKPDKRTSVDGVFLLNEDQPETRAKLFRNFGGGIPSMRVFNALMDAFAVGHSALYIHNRNRTRHWTENVYWYEPELIDPNWKAGSHGYWRHAEDRTKKECW